MTSQSHTFDLSASEVIETDPLTGAGETLPEDRVSGPVSGDTEPAQGCAPEPTHDEPEATASGEPTHCNDAEFWGKDCPEFDALLAQSATLMNGEMWGARDGRNTQDGKWVQTPLPWAHWILGQDGTKNTPAWGFSRHPVGKNKEGICIVLGSSIGKARKAKAMENMFAIGLDIDSGASLNKVLARIEELGLCALVYTSYNHNKRGLHLKRDDVLRKLGIKGDPTVDEVRQYLKDFDKNRYEENFIAQIEITDPKKQVKDGVVIELSTPPLEKFRLIFPLAEAVKIVDLAERHDDALSIWEDTVTGLAVNLLGVHFDTSCTDPSRLFYTARHPADADDYYAAVVRGRPLTFDEIEPFKKSLYTSKRGKLNPFEVASGDTSGGDKPPMAFTPSGKSLNEWHSRAKERFLLADVLETYCPDRIRIAGGEAQGHVHVECVFESEHSKEGGTGTMAVNALDSKEGFWTWFCHHDACQGRHKLQYLEEALRQEWFPESVLFDDEFILPAEDGEDDSVIEEIAPLDRTERHADAAASVRDALLELVASFSINTTEPEVRAVIRQALVAGADAAARGHLKDAIAKVTAIKARDFNRLLKEEQAAFKRKKNGRSKKAGADIESFDVLEDYPAQVEYAKARIRAANEECPTLFQFGGIYATADAVRHRVRLMEDRDSMFSVLSGITCWTKTDSDGEARLVPPPEAVVRALYKNSDLADSLPELLAVPSTPFFDRGGNLVADDGYHAGARVFLAKGDLVLPGVSREPTPEEVTEAKRLIVEEVLADFPLGGMDRKQIVATLNGENPDRAHAVTHAVAMTLLPFCRELIDGPTPGHVFTKPGPGTGASLLVEALTVITSGEPAPAMELPARPEEIGKTLSAALAEGAPVILFDNVGQAIASSALAMAMTGTTYQARILGRTQLVTVPVRVVWTFTANNIEASKEILRRLILTPLDAGVPDPEKRTPRGGWRHANLRQWVTENRPELVWACLTIIQNWVAKGMVGASAPSLASYESWARVMGGILSAAGFNGFLDGQDEERAKASDSNEDGLIQLLRVFADYPSGTVFRAGGISKFGKKATVSVQALLNGVVRARIEPGDCKPDPIQINGWRYNSLDGEYRTAAKIGHGMKTLARKPHRVGEVVISFEELPDPKDGRPVYRMTKKLPENDEGEAA